MNSFQNRSLSSSTGVDDNASLSISMQPLIPGEDKENDDRTNSMCRTGILKTPRESLLPNDLPPSSHQSSSSLHRNAPHPYSRIQNFLRKMAPIDPTYYTNNTGLFHGNAGDFENFFHSRICDFEYLFNNAKDNMLAQNSGRGVDPGPFVGMVRASHQTQGVGVEMSGEKLIYDQ
jgi:hypothetical protein